MDLQLIGKRAVITGGSRGIGKAIARQLALEGCDVAIGARTDGPLQEAAAELREASGRKVVPLPLDTMDPESIKSFVAGAADALGGIDILINSAARVGGAPGTIETVEESDVIRDFQEKAIGYFRVARAAIPHLKENGWGRIVNINGGAGRAPGQAISGGLRNIAVVNLTKSMANALGQYGITVNAIDPAITVTESYGVRFGEEATRRGQTLDAYIAAQGANTPIGRLVTADDLAPVVAFLCSPLSISITGEIIVCNGGASPDVRY
jgi:NAD(P)-dependent dehydrogenase (short-subunit alcohol dehydrogenase family)